MKQHTGIWQTPGGPLSTCGGLCSTLSSPPTLPLPIPHPRQCDINWQIESPLIGLKDTTEERWMFYISVPLKVLFPTFWAKSPAFSLCRQPHKVCGWLGLGAYEKIEHPAPSRSTKSKCTFPRFLGNIITHDSFEKHWSRRMLSNMTATGHVWLWNTWNDASLNWDVL